MVNKRYINTINNEAEENLSDTIISDDMIIRGIQIFQKK